MNKPEIIMSAFEDMHHIYISVERKEDGEFEECCIRLRCDISDNPQRASKAFRYMADSIDKLVKEREVKT